jgi:hypothetical protein
VRTSRTRPLLLCASLMLDGSHSRVKCLSLLRLMAFSGFIRKQPSHGVLLTFEAFEQIRIYFKLILMFLVCSRIPHLDSPGRKTLFVLGPLETAITAAELGRLMGLKCF